MDGPVEVQHACPAGPPEDALLVENASRRVEAGLDPGKGAVHHVVVVQGDHRDVELGLQRGDQHLKPRELGRLVRLAGGAALAERLHDRINRRAAEIAQGVRPDRRGVPSEKRDVGHPLGCHDRAQRRGRGAGGVSRGDGEDGVQQVLVVRLAAQERGHRPLPVGPDQALDMLVQVRRGLGEQRVANLDGVVDQGPNPRARGHAEFEGRTGADDKQKFSFRHGAPPPSDHLGDQAAHLVGEATPLLRGQVPG